MAFDSANLVLSGTAWSVDQPQNGGDRYLSVSMSKSWTDKQSGQRKYGQPQHYRVYPARFAQGLQAVLDQIGQLRNQGLMVDVTVVGTIGSVNAYVSQKDNTPKASVTVNAHRHSHHRHSSERRSPAAWLRPAARLHAASAGRIPAVSASGLRPMVQ